MRTLVGNKIVDHSDVVGNIACRRCSNYIFILDLTPGFNGLGKDNCKTRRETFKHWDFGAPYLRGLMVINLRMYCTHCWIFTTAGTRWLTTIAYLYNDVIMDTIASQITSLTIVYSTVYSGADKRKHESSASLAFVWGIHRGPVNSPHKWPVTRKMFSFDDVIMITNDSNIGRGMKFQLKIYSSVEYFRVRREMMTSNSF